MIGIGFCLKCLKSPHRTAAALQALVLMNCLRLVLLAFPVSGFKFLLKVATPGQEPCTDSGAKEKVQSVVLSINQAGRFVPDGARCLVAALSAQLLLKQKGVSGVLRIGILPKDKSPFQAHAWLEYDGEVIVGGPVDHIENVFPVITP